MPDNPTQTRLLRAGLVLLAVVPHLNILRIQVHLGDDRLFVADNYLTTHPSLAHALRFFTEIHKDFYQPVPLLAYMVDYAIWGNWWPGFHLTSLAIHALNALMVFWLLRGWIGRERPAWLAAAVFAVHPLALETIGLLSGRFVQLSVTGALAAMLCYLHWRDSSETKWFVASLVFAALGHMSKLVLGLPAALLVLDLSRGKCRHRRDLLPLVPFAAMSVFFGWLAVIGSHRAGMLQMERVTQVETNVAIAGLATAKYLLQLLWPTRLASWYPRPMDLSLSDPRAWGSWLTLGVITAGCVWAGVRRRQWHWLAGWAFFLAMIFQFVGLVPARSTLLADRYMYLPMVGLLLIAACLLERACSALWRPGLAYGLVVAAAVPLGVLSWRQATYRRTDLADKRYMVRIYPDEVGSYLMLSRSSRIFGLRSSGEQQARYYRQALEAARKAQSLEEHYAAGKLEEAEVYLAMGKPDQALGPALEAMRRKPDYHKAVLAAVRAYVKLNRPDEALALMRRERLAELYPQSIRTHLALASIYRLKGDMGKAQECYRRVVQINPYHSEAWYSLGTLYLRTGLHAAAIDAFTRTLSIDPDHAEAMTNLATALLSVQGPQVAERAMELYSRALDLQPKMLQARLDRGELCLSMDRASQALADARIALQDYPGQPQALSLAVRSAVAAEAFPEAVRFARKSLEATDSPPLDVLSVAAYAALRDGDLEQARTWSARAISARAAPGLNRLVETLSRLRERPETQALARLRRLIDDPNARPSKTELQAALLALGDWPDQHATFAARAVLLTALGRNSEAAEAAARARRAASQPARAGPTRPGRQPSDGPGG